MKWTVKMAGRYRLAAPQSCTFPGSQTSKDLKLYLGNERIEAEPPEYFSAFFRSPWQPFFTLLKNCSFQHSSSFRREKGLWPLEPK